MILFLQGEEDKVFGKSEWKQFLDGDIGDYDGGFNALEQFKDYQKAVALSVVETEGIKVRPLYVRGSMICAIDYDVCVWDGLTDSWIDCVLTPEFVQTNFINID